MFAIQGAQTGQPGNGRYLLILQVAAPQAQGLEGIRLQACQMLEQSGIRDFQSDLHAGGNSHGALRFSMVFPRFPAASGVKGRIKWFRRRARVEFTHGYVVGKYQLHTGLWGDAANLDGHRIAEYQCRGAFGSLGRVDMKGYANGMFAGHQRQGAFLRINKFFIERTLKAINSPAEQAGRGHHSGVTDGILDAVIFDYHAHRWIINTQGTCPHILKAHRELRGFPSSPLFLFRLEDRL